DSAKRVKSIVRCSLVAVTPWLMLFLWSAHTKNNFDYATETIHALSVENYAAVLGEKTWDDIAAITKGYWSKYLEIQSPEIVMLIFFDCSLLVASSVLALSERRYDAKKLMWFALKLNGVLICYAVGLWAMYLLSMPPDEAMTVNGFERYLCGFLVWMYGYSLWRLLGWYAANENNTRLVAGLMCICLTISCLGYMLKRESLVSYHSGKVDRYDRIVQQLEEYNPDEYYTLLYPANGYDWFCMRYKLWTADLDWRSQISAEDAEDIISYYDYLIVLDQTEAVKKVLAPYVAGPEYTGGYQVTWEDELVLIPAM
ncbi:MAG: hypothetical protein IJ461_11075, partial [Clostridia bacterium]|nr:hypothetical protein [Clostridia bacterium]